MAASCSGASTVTKAAPTRLVRLEGRCFGEPVRKFLLEKAKEFVTEQEALRASMLVTEGKDGKHDKDDKGAQVTNDSDKLKDSDLLSVIQNLDFSEENLWGPKDNVQQRVGNIGKKVLWELIILPIYIQSEEVHLDVFWIDRRDARGRPLPKHKRSKLNDRNEADTRDNCKASIKVCGLQQQASSMMIVIATDDIDLAALGSKDVLAACHRYEGLVDAFYEEPHNLQVAMSVQRKLKAMEMKPETPADIQVHAVNTQNEHQLGSLFSVQLLC